MRGFISFLLMIHTQAALISIDLGTEYIKTSIVTPSRKIELIESSNPTPFQPNAIAFSEFRLYGDKAYSQLTVSPALSIQFNQRLLGIPFNSTNRNNNEYVGSNYVKTLKGTFGYSIRNRVMMADEILAMQLENFKSSEVKECVISVPSFYTQAQRRNLLAIAEIAGFKVAGIVNENTAAGLFYALDRSDENPIYVIVYNAGASYVQASLLKYWAVKQKKHMIVERKCEHLEVIDHSWTDNFGGRTIDTFIADFIAEEFVKVHKKDPRDNPIAKAKIIQQAAKAKKQLSFQTQVNIVLKDLIDSISFEITLNQTLIENFVNEHENDLLKPIFKILENQNLTIADIESIELTGGLTRIPSIQNLITKSFKEPLDDLNEDEVIAKGAALFGMNFSSEVQIRQIWLSEYFQHKVLAEIVVGEDEPRVKEVFNEKSVWGSSKKIALNVVEDMEIKLNIEYENDYIEVARYKVNDIKWYAEKYMQVPNVVIEFKIDRYGIVQVAAADLKVEIEVKYEEPVNDTKNSNETSTSNDTNASNETKSSNETQSSEDQSSLEESTIQDKENDSEDKITEDQENSSEESEESSVSSTDPTAESTETDTNSTNPQSNSTDDSTNSTTPKTRTVYKKKQLKYKLSVHESISETPAPLSDSEKSNIKYTLDIISNFEKELKLRMSLQEEIKNYLTETEARLEDEKFLRVLSPADLLSLKNLTSSTRKWLDGQDIRMVSGSLFIENKQNIANIVNPAIRKEKELAIRDSSVTKAYEKLDAMYKDMRYLNKTKTWVSASVKGNVFKSINDTVAWIDSKVEEQKGVKDWELPVLKVTTLEAKVKGAEKKVEIIRNMPRPRKVDL